MSYIYSQQMYQEGTLYYGISSMLEPMTASAYADWIVQKVYQNVGDIYCVNTKEATDEEQTYLQDRAQTLYDYYDLSFSTTDFVSINGTMSTYIEKEYAFQYNGEEYTVIVIKATDLVQYTQSMGSFSDTLVQMTVPYVYVYASPSEETVEGRGKFDLFMSNTRVSDEFVRTHCHFPYLSILGFISPTYLSKILQFLLIHQKNHLDLRQLLHPHAKANQIKGHILFTQFNQYPWIFLVSFNTLLHFPKLCGRSFITR